MKHLSIVTIAAVVLVACGSSRRAEAGIRARAAYRSASVSVSTSVSVAPSGAPPAGSWHGEYYDTAWGMPVGVLVSPRPRTQTNYGWGIGGTTVTPVQPQFQRMEPPPSEYRRAGFQSRPPWPSNTNQFGDYYIRGPR